MVDDGADQRLAALEARLRPLEGPLASGNDRRGGAGAPPGAGRGGPSSAGSR